MEWAKELFLHDCGLSSWSEVKKAGDKKNKKSRPPTYLDWFKKVTTKVS